MKLSITETESLIMHIFLYASWGLIAGVIIGVWLMRKSKKETIAKDINRPFEFK